MFYIINMTQIGTSINADDILYLKSKGINRASFIRQAIVYHKTNNNNIITSSPINSKRVCVSMDADDIIYLIDRQIKIVYFIRTMIELHRDGVFEYKYI